MSISDLLSGIAEFYKWLFGGLWRGVTAPFRWVRRMTPSGFGFGHPLAFRLDLWAQPEGATKMAMDVRPETIDPGKPWLALLSPAARRAGKTTALGILFQAVDIHTDSKKLVFSTSGLKDTVGTTYAIKLEDIMAPQKINIAGFMAELVLGLTVISFAVKGSDERKFLVLPSRGMWWPATMMRPHLRRGRIKGGPGMALAFESLAGWAKTGKWV